MRCMMAGWKVGWQMGANMSCFRLRILSWRLKPRVSKGEVEILKSPWSSDSHQDLILKKKKKSLSILMCIFLGLKYNCSISEMKSGRCFSWQCSEGFLAFRVASRNHLFSESLSGKDVWVIPTNSVRQGRANPAAVYFHQTSWSVRQILQMWWNPKYSLSNTFLL